MSEGEKEALQSGSWSCCFQSFLTIAKEMFTSRWPKKWKISSQKTGKETAGLNSNVHLQQRLVTKHLPKILAKVLDGSAHFAEVVGHSRVVVQQWLRVGPQGLRFDRNGGTSGCVSTNKD